MNHCQCCGGAAKLITISAKCSDRYYERNEKTGKEYDGYVKDWLGEYGDYIAMTVCRHCGHVQGDWPHWNKDSNQFRSGKAFNDTNGHSLEEREKIKSTRKKG